MPIPPRTSENHLLASLQGMALDRLLPHLSLVDMTAGDSVIASGSRQAHVYFPVSATIALSYVAQDGLATEISVVGNEGMIGIPLFLKGRISPSSAQVRASGAAFRMIPALLTKELNRPGPALRVILAYARDLSAQMDLFALGAVDAVDDPRSVRR